MLSPTPVVTAAMPARRLPAPSAARSRSIGATTRRRSVTRSIPTRSRAAAFAAMARRRQRLRSNRRSTIWPGCCGIDPFEIRRKNMVGPDDWIESVWKDPSDVGFGSYGLDQCLDLVEDELAKGGGLPKPEGDEWAEGTGVALAMLENPPTEHRSGALMTLRPDGTYHLAVGSTEMGNGSVTAHRQIAAAILGATCGFRRHHQCRYRSLPLRQRDLRQHGYRRCRQGSVPYRGSPARQHLRLRQSPRRGGTLRLPPRGQDGGLRRTADCADRIFTLPAARPATGSKPSAGPIFRRARSRSTSTASGSPCTA